MLSKGMEERKYCANSQKGDKQLIRNYRPVSLLPICRKVFEKIIFNSLFKHLENNNLLNPHQSGFCPGDSCVHQLLSITYDIYKSFDANPSREVRGIFLDMCQKHLTKSRMKISFLS